MSPYLPFAALPLAAFAGWFAATNWSSSDPNRFHVPRAGGIDDPSALMKTRSSPDEDIAINVKAFLPHVPPKPPAPEPTLILDSVMTGADVNLASINGRIVKRGDKVEGYFVNRIAADGVQLVRGGKIRQLPMRPIHELPPIARSKESGRRKVPNSERTKAELTQDFWKIFDSLEI